MQRQFHSFCSILVIALLMTGMVSTYASVIYVSGNVSGTWSADTVIVQNNIYVPMEQSLMIDHGVKVLFENHFSFTVDSLATLDALGAQFDEIVFDTLAPNDYWNGIRFLGASNNSRLADCLIRKGYANGTGENAHGGAIYCRNSSPLITYCVISYNRAAVHGGAIYLTNNSHPTLEHSTITYNATEEGNGGAIYCNTGCDPTLLSNDIQYNSANGGYSGHGGGIFIEVASPTIIENWISNNSANAFYSSGSGGGIYCHLAGPSILNNTIGDNDARGSGGGIFAVDSNFTIAGNDIANNTATLQNGGGLYLTGNGITHSTIIENNIIIDNSAFGRGGGFYINSGAAPIIRQNTISFNTSGSGGYPGGGGITCDWYVDNCIITDNTIECNSTSYNGGGIALIRSNPQISNNEITDNFAGSKGGGLYGEQNSNPAISGNIIKDNECMTLGGGIYVEQSTLFFNIELNEITRNTGQVGGGIYLNSSNPKLNKNTIAYNTSDADSCGGLRSLNCTPQVINDILWANSGSQIEGEFIVSYCDVMGGYGGPGNISGNPLFVNAGDDDFHLQANSPCINAGDPNPIYNDPDSTRADMGCYYFDQWVPPIVTITLTPINPPIQIPATGGSFNFDVTIANLDNLPHQAVCWINVTLPNGSTYGPVLGPLTLTLPPNLSLTRQRTQTVPASAPAGSYIYNGWAVAGGDTNTSSFPFVKLATGNGSLTGSWSNSGQSYNDWLAESEAVSPTEFVLRQPTPNPFNPVTTIRYTLPEAATTRLSIYDIAGREVIRLCDGWSAAGNHEIRFDGSALASGIYFCRLQAGANTLTNKLVLLK